MASPESGTSTFRDLRTAHKRLSKTVQQQSTLLLAATEREQRIRAAAVLAVHEHLPEGPAKALLDLALRRTDLSLDDALATVASVFGDSE